ncbi:MAG: hypothetical protein ACXVZL_08205 [Gaiellaceae bacterium]
MPAPTPTPIGLGPRYHPAPALHARCVRGPLAGDARVHLELFANGRVVIVPTGIGLRRARLELGRVVDASCRARLRTLDPTGVVEVDGTATVGDLFRVWGRRLGPRRLLSFTGAVRAFRNGRLWRGDPRALELRDGDELVLEVGRYVTPHRSYSFPPR